MPDISDLLTLKEIGVLEDSEFYSSHGAHMKHARDYIARELKKNEKGVSFEEILRVAQPTLSHMKIYELGCGLQVLLPFDAKTGELTTSDEIYANVGCTEENGVLVLGNRPVLRDNILVLLERSDVWSPLGTRGVERIKGRELGKHGGFVVTEVSGLSTKIKYKWAEFNGLTAVLTYGADIAAEQRAGKFNVAYEEPRVGRFFVAYEVFRGKSKTADMRIELAPVKDEDGIDCYDKSAVVDVYEKNPITTPVKGARAHFKFADDGEIAEFEMKSDGSTFEQKAGKLIDNLVYAEATYDNVSVADFATMCIFASRDSPGKILDYAGTIQGMISSVETVIDEIEWFAPIMFH